MKNATIYIFGHKNPDSDSVCAAIAYAELKRKLGYTNATPAIMGELNNETKYILDYFGVKEPPVIENVRSQVSDMDYYDPVTVFPDTTIGTAWDIMMNTGRRMLTVIDKDDESFIGVVSSGDISRLNMSIENCSVLSQYKPTINNLVTTLNASVLFGNLKDHKNHIIGGKVIVAMAPDEIMNEFPEEGDLIIARASEKCIKAALSTQSKYIFIIGECIQEWEINFDPINKDRIIFCTKYDVCTAIKLINNCIPVSSIMRTKDIVFFYESDYYVEVKNTFLDVRYRNFPILNDDNKVVGTVSRRHVIDVDKKKVILVDHNERSQSVPGLEEAEILEVVDHHRVGDLQTGAPILFRNEPVGSSCTIVANMYFEHNIKPSKKIAGLLLSAIISDTLLFKSPTCTIVDKMTAEKLAQIADVNIETYGLSMLKAGASFKGRTMKEILYTDFKEFNFGSRRIFVSQVYTTDLGSVEDIKEEMKELMDMICEEREFELGAIMFTDILGSGTKLLYTGKSKDIAEKAFNAERGTNMVFLPRVVSRKKEVIPPLSKLA